MEYIVVNGTMCEIDDKVNKLIQEGYTPIGGVSLSTSKLIYQAMIKNNVDDDLLRNISSIRYAIQSIDRKIYGRGY
jgi:hypothetical protein